MKRRNFLKLVGMASGTLATRAAIRDADQKILPYLVPPKEGAIPGIPYFVNTSCRECPAGCGITVKMNDSRPVKLEGLSLHPVNDGVLCARGQASLARLHHPRRVLRPRLRVDGRWRELSWKEALALIAEKAAAAAARGNKNLFLRSHSSGSLPGLINRFCQKMQFGRLPEFELFSYAALRQANDILFRQKAWPRFTLDTCDLILSMGMDLFNSFSSPVEFARTISLARRRGGRWYHFEPHLSATGLAANRRFVLPPGTEPLFLSWLIRESQAKFPLPAEILDLVPKTGLDEVIKQTGIEREVLRQLKLTVIGSGRPAILAGEAALAGEHGLLTAVLAGLLQWSFGMVPGRMDFSFAMPLEDLGDGTSLQDFHRQLRQGTVGVLFLSRVHAFPGALVPAADLKKAAFRVMGLEVENSLADHADLLLPLADSLETWDDIEPYRGIFGLVQPVQKPRDLAWAEGDILLKLMGEAQTYQDYIRQAWGDRWEDLLQRGFLYKTGPGIPVQLQPDRIRQFLKDARISAPQSSMQLVLVPSPRHFDGRSRELDLLNEIPDSLSAVSYDACLAVAPGLAKKNNWQDGMELAVETPAGTGYYPLRLQPGLTETIVCLAVDQASSLQLPLAPGTGDWQVLLPVRRLKATGKKIQLPILAACRDASRRGILEPHDTRYHRNRPSMFAETKYSGYHWSMVIDLDLCFGCSACVAACYIENNVPLTGKEMHLRGREMSWIRIESYLNRKGLPVFMPMLCQHCDAAPCESACPVSATYHNPEGLNAQIYNRCVGTRYCAVNCPYQVRRFNYFPGREGLPLYALSNPDVSLRPRGVMEKCSFCSQRIRSAHELAREKKIKITEDELTPACAQTCPSGAIVFGNLLDQNSRVCNLAKSEGIYRVLEEVGSQPSVYYLRRRG